MNYQLAEINIARIKGITIDDPIMKEFVDNLDTINNLAENSPGFVWRLKDDSNNATNLNPYNDVQIIINISVWENVETLSNYVYKTVHSDFLRRRKEWFKNYGNVSTAMWWIPEGKYPSVEEAVEKLAELQKNGTSTSVFNFKNTFPKPK
ncbi:DUF3291 domain-containing protein [uncultured Maribacter sp.]|uniref:DUF3291 domain-containing protein n=1 Tax=uncultured Maribacter sp. TaxID=431308 RepID=UPI002606CE3B|nr:DUF3291 domain-containing protein [uncultured Maribacter sp.]